MLVWTEEVVKISYGWGKVFFKWGVEACLIESVKFPFGAKLHCEAFCEGGVEDYCAVGGTEQKRIVIRCGDFVVEFGDENVFG